MGWSFLCCLLTNHGLWMELSGFSCCHIHWKLGHSSPYLTLSPFSSFYQLSSFSTFSHNSGFWPERLTIPFPSKDAVIAFLQQLFISLQIPTSIVSCVYRSHVKLLVLNSLRWIHSSFKPHTNLSHNAWIKSIASREHFQGYNVVANCFFISS